MANFTGIPSEICEFLNKLDSQDKPPSWKFQRTDGKKVLTIFWTIYSEHSNPPPKPRLTSSLPRDQVPPCLMSANVEKLWKKPHVNSHANRKKKKSPSQLKRDKARWQTWKQRRTGIQSSIVPPVQRDPGISTDPHPVSVTVSVTPTPSDSIDTELQAKDLPGSATPNADKPPSVSPAPDPVAAAPATASKPPTPQKEVPHRTENICKHTNPSLSDDDSGDEDRPSCDNCFLKASATRVLKTCTGCQFMKYCSKACQSRHWKDMHKNQCRELAEISKLEGRP